MRRADLPKIAPLFDGRADDTLRRLRACATPYSEALHMVTQPGKLAQF